MSYLFRHLSIRNKLMIVLICTSAVALLVATVGFMLNGRHTQFEDKHQDAQITARIIAFNAGAALAFHDKVSAMELLDSLRSDPDVQSASLYAADGILFASYVREGMEDEARQNDSERMDILQPVMLDGEEIGRLQLHISQEGLEHTFRKNAWMVVLLALFSLFLSVLFSLWMQRLISGPVAQVADKMRNVTDSKDYSLRVEWHSADELGELANNFNAMLQQIQQQDELLEQHREVLEKTVEERTAQLRDGIERLQKAESSLNKIMQAMMQTGEAVMILNTDGSVDYFNPVCLEMTGYGAEELAREPSLLLGEDIVEEIWPKVLSGDSWKEEVSCTKKSGEHFAGLLSLSPTVSPAGEVEQVVAILRDLSDREALEEQLRQSQKMEAVGVLVGGIAHDFNNLLAGIVGNLELAKADIHDPKAMNTWLGEIEGISFRAADTISKLLAFARKNRIEMEQLQLNTFLQAVERLARVGIPESVNLSFDTSRNDLWVEADVNQLQQAVLNLLNNAVDAVHLQEEREPEVEVIIDAAIPDPHLRSRFPTLRNERYATIRVRDNGPGIAKEHLDKIFEPFFTTKPVGKGTGLGLSMAYGLTQRHGGALNVESTPGNGCEFVMLLPLVEPPARKMQPVLPLSQTPAGRGELVLLADDEELVRNFISHLLQRLGYRVLVAADGVEVVELFEKHVAEVDLVILDLVMPHQGGGEAARHIRNLAPEIPIIFASGYDLNSSMMEEQDLPSGFLLQKPYRAHELGRVLREHLD